MDKENTFENVEESYEQKRVRNTLEQKRALLQFQLQEKSDLFTAEFKKKVKKRSELETEFLPTFDHSDSESESTPKPSRRSKSTKKLPKIVVVDESAKPMNDGDKANQENLPSENAVGFHKFCEKKSLLS